MTSDPLKTDFRKMAQLVREVDDQAKGQFDSICNQTMVGFAMDTSKPGTLQSHPVTCFYGHKDFRQLYEDQVASKGRQPAASHSQTGATVHIDGEEVAVLIDEAQANEAPVAQTSWSRGKHANLFAEFKKSDETDKRITHINDNPELYAWKANPCLLQDHHPQYDHSACSDEE